MDDIIREVIREFVAMVEDEYIYKITFYKSYWTDIFLALPDYDYIVDEDMITYLADIIDWPKECQNSADFWEMVRYIKNEKLGGKK